MVLGRNLLLLRALGSCIPAAAASQPAPQSLGHPVSFPRRFPGEPGRHKFAPGSESGFGRGGKAAAGDERDEWVLQSAFNEATPPSSISAALERLRTQPRSGGVFTQRLPFILR